MSRAIRADYQQTFLLPPSLEDWVGPDHPARFLRTFVDELKLAELGFDLEVKDKGRPPFAVDLLLKVWLYGYMCRIRSTRKLEQSCRDSMGFLWLCGNQAPDHLTLWRFWRENRQQIAKVFKQSVKLAIRCNYVGLALQAVDGTRIASAASERTRLSQAKAQELLKQVDQQIQEIEKALEAQAPANEQDEPGAALPKALQQPKRLRERIAECLKQMEETETDQGHPQDPTARSMRIANQKTPSLAHNAQAAVDAEHQIITAAEVTDDQSDEKQLQPTLEQAEENCGERAKENVADTGYSSSEALAAAQKAGFPVTMPLQAACDPKEPEKSPFHTCHFHYDEKRDVMICPQGQPLEPCGTRTRKSGKEVRCFRCVMAKFCPVSTQCSKDPKGRKVDLDPHWEAVLAHRKKMASEEAKATLRKRSGIVEPVFAWIKQHAGLRRWTMCGIENVRAQWALACTALNLVRIHRLNLTAKGMNAHATMAATAGVVS